MFEANVHSKSQVRWKVVSPECSEEVRAVLTECYGVSGVQSVLQVDEWEQASHNYRVAYRKLGGASREVLLRRHILQEIDSIRTSTAMIGHLRNHAVSTPAIILANGGRSFVESGGYYWQMFEFFAGDHFRGEEGELSKVATLIARMHHAFDVFPDKRNIGSIDAILAPLDTTYWNSIPAIAGVSPFEGFLREKRAFIREEVARVSCVLPSESQYGVIHGDLHPYNLLFSERQECAILDFGNMCIADQRYDIAMALHRLVRQYVVYQGKPWRETLPEGVRIFLDAYASMDLSVMREMNFLPVFMKGLLLRRIAGNAYHYRKGTRSWENCLSQCTRFLGYLEEVNEIEAILS